jgi:hypothetical protein
MHDVIRGVIDRDSWMEIQPGWAQNIIVGFARSVVRSRRHRRAAAGGARGLLSTSMRR